MTPLLRYVGSIIVRPFATWKAIASERIPLGRLAFAYVLPLALVGPAATFYARHVLGLRVGHIVYRSDTASALGQAEFAFTLAVAGVLLVALLVAALAPLFGAARSFGKALRVTAFAATPVWIAALTVLAPAFGFIQLLALVDEIFLLYAGLNVVMGVPRAKAGGLAACAVGGTIAIAIALGGLLSAVAGGG